MFNYCPTPLSREWLHHKQKQEQIFEYEIKSIKITQITPPIEPKSGTA